MSAASLRQLISLESETLDDLRTAVAAQAETAAQMIGMVGTNRQQIVKIIQGIAEDIRDDVTRIIVSARLESAQLAYAQVVIEATLIGTDVPDEPNDDEDNEARAMAVGHSYAAAWLLAALAMVVGRKSNIKKISKLQDYRLARIATTEVAESYGQAALRAYALMPRSETVLKRWDATLDMRTCGLCRGHHNETVPLDDDFRDGDEPGAVHPRCRCVPTLVSKAA